MSTCVDSALLAASLREVASNPPTDLEARRELYHAAQSLALQVERPFDTINRVCLSFGNLTTAKVLVDLQVFRALAEEPNKEWKIEQLADESGADVQLLGRLLRYQAMSGNVRQMGQGKFSASHITPFLALPGTEAAINHSFLTVSNNFLHLPRYLADSGYTNPSDPKHMPAHLAFNYDGDLSTWFATHPVHAGAAFTYFANQRADQQGCFVGAPIAKYALSEQDDNQRVLFCDIGGGSGHQCLAFRAQRPELKGPLAVTDIPSMIDQQDRTLLTSQGITSFADDFFSTEPYPIPLRHAKMYYMRNVLHDWNDDRSMAILKRIRAAAATDSVLVLDELMIPDTNASVGACNLDLSMMTVSSAERSLVQWKDLLTRAGFDILQTWCYDEDRGDNLIFAKPVVSA